MNINNVGTMYLSGGGDESSSRAVDGHFVEAVFSRANSPKILYIPLALNRDAVGFEQAYDWFTNLIGALADQFVEVAAWTNLNATPSNLSGYTAIYIGGGNAFKLLQWMDDTGFGSDLKSYITGGGLVYGGSAGAIVLGKDIRTVAEENKSVGYSKFSWLDLLNGYSVACHYSGSMRDGLADSAKRMATNILCLPEGSGIMVEFPALEFVSVGNINYEVLPK